MSSELLNTLAIVSTVVGIFSLCVSVIAIWITLHFKHEADVTNQSTKTTLVRMEATSKLIKDDLMKELTKYGDMSRQIIIDNKVSSHTSDDSIRTNSTAIIAISDPKDS